ncbi:hypothetical protein DV738_g4183, partial [Chaetothyriales sp. CBS 135597]
MDSFNQSAIPFTAMLLPDARTMTMVQAAFTLALLSLVIACAFNALYYFCRQTPVFSSKRLSALGPLAAVLLYCYLADRTLVFQKVEKVVNETTFICLCLVALVFGVATARCNALVGVSTVSGKSEHDGETVELLPRQQTEEWKGWMQIAILLYHYFGMSRVLHVYQLIRVLVGSYLFLTGYGHATYFLRTNDFSLHRVVSVLTRLNMLTCLLPFVMGSKYDMYYFPALSTFWFLVTWAVVPKTSGTLAWHKIPIRILLAIICTELLLVLPAVWHDCAYLLHTAKAVNLDAGEFLFRLSLDRFVPYAGILAAYANERGHRIAAPSWWSPRLNQVAVVTSLCSLVPYFLFLSKLNNKEESNRSHPVTEIVPILAFLTLRNSHPTLRRYHSRLFSWVGRHSLETYVLQYHIWLAADAKKILSFSGFPTRLPADPPLASHGVRQAEETGVLLAETLYEAAASDRLRIYSSLFYRCLETLRPTVQLLQAKLDASDSDKRRRVLVRGERGVGEWFGRAWFTQPSPARPQTLKTDFFPWLDDGYQSLLVPHEKGERIEELHKRVATALELLVTDVEEEFLSQGRGDEDVTVLICGHAAQIIATGRALTGSVPDDYDEEDFRCYTCGISKFPDAEARNTMSPGGLPLPSCPEQYRRLISSLVSELRPQTLRPRQPCRHFHNYFITHLPSSSLHPDSRSVTGLAHKLPRKDSTPHTPDGRSAPAAHPSISRDTTVVRIPLVSAKHHYGAAVSRGRRPYNEDAHQAGVVEVPAFAKKPPASVRITKAVGESFGGESASGDPQVFYFGVFDGHGGAECSNFLRERLHTYIEQTANQFGFQSTLQGSSDRVRAPQESDGQASSPSSIAGAQETTINTVKTLEQGLVTSWKDLVGGYFKRFKPPYFSLYSDMKSPGQQSDLSTSSGKESSEPVPFEEVLAYSFLKADYDFIAAQAAKKDGALSYSQNPDRPLNDGDILDNPHKLADHIGGATRFKGGSTCSVVMVSTPSPTPFWHPATTSTMLVAHVGDTRVLICSTSTGAAVPLTTNHHPSSPVEGTRLRRYAATFVTDSFGEERISGLANTRAFGDINSKRIGVSAEPEITRLELGVAEYSFLVLVSDGVSGTLSDQEIVDIVKEAKTPDQAARNVVDFATEVSMDGDNTTCMVVRLGGWERRQEGGHGSLGTKESRQFKRETAADPRSSRSEPCSLLPHLATHSDSTSGSGSTGGTRARLPADVNNSFATAHYPLTPLSAAMPDTLKPNGHAHPTARRLSVSEAMEKLDESIYKQENIFLFIPNLIGYARIVLAFASLYYMPIHPRTCSLLYSISCLLDALDGLAARRYNQSTTFGAVLDMVTDRCTTSCLLVFLAQAFPRWSIVFQALISLDLASHYIHMYAMLHVGGSGSSHKKVDEKRSWILHLYYTNRPGSPAYPKLSSIFPNPWSAGAMEIARANKIDSTIPWVLAGISFPVMLGKQIINVIQMINASKMLGEGDRAAREQARRAAAIKNQ